MSGGVVEGPEVVAKVPASFTGRYLAPLFKGRGGEGGGGVDYNTVLIRSPASTTH